MFPSKLLVRVPRTIYGIALLLELDKTLLLKILHTLDLEISKRS